MGEGGVGPLKALFNTKKKNEKKKNDVLLSLFILIFISIGPFFIRDIL